jgi:hypothetical protein
MSDEKHTPNALVDVFQMMAAHARGLLTVPEDYEAFIGIEPADAALIAAAPEMLAMLKSVEWCQMTINDGGTIHETVKYCPKCGHGQSEGHRKDCRLSALIAKAEGKNA